MRAGHVRDADVERGRHGHREPAHRAADLQRGRREQQGAVGHHGIRAHPAHPGLGRPGGGRDRREPRQRVLDVGRQGHQRRPDGVAAALALLGAHVDRDERDQRALGQLLHVGEEPAQPTRADRHEHVVERRAAGLGDGAQPAEVVLLGREPPGLADPAVQHRVRRLVRRDRAGRGAPAPQLGLDERLGDRGRRADRRRQTAHDRGEVTDRVGLARGPLALGEAEEERVLAVVGVLRQAALEQPHPGVAVDEGVVDLDVGREPVARQPLDDVQLPRGPAEVERVGVQPRHEHPELALAGRARQGGVAHVVVDVELVVDDPAVHRLAHQHAGLQPQVPRRLDRRGAQGVDEVGEELRAGVLRQRQVQHRRDVHEGLVGLPHEEDRVQG